MIVKVEVTLEDDKPDFLANILRCESVISYNTFGSEYNHQELIDNTEYHDEIELIEDLANRLKIQKEMIHIKRY